MKNVQKNFLKFYPNPLDLYLIYIRPPGSESISELYRFKTLLFNALHNIVILVVFNALYYIVTMVVYNALYIQYCNPGSF